MNRTKALKVFEIVWLVLALIPTMISFPHFFRTLRETSPFSMDSTLFFASYIFLFSPMLYAGHWRSLAEKEAKETKGQRIKRGFCLLGLITLVLGVTWLGLHGILNKAS